MEIMLSEDQGRWVKRIIKSGNENEFFQNLSSEFQDKKYKVLHQCAFDELGYEYKNLAFTHLHAERMRDLPYT